MIPRRRRLSKWASYAAGAVVGFVVARLLFPLPPKLEWWEVQPLAEKICYRVLTRDEKQAEVYADEYAKCVKQVNRVLISWGWGG